MAAGQIGLTFNETMIGGFALGPSDPAAGEKMGEQNGTTFAMRAVIVIDDLDRFIADAQHAASLSGEIDFTPFGSHIPGDHGIFNLFKPASNQKLMVYELSFSHNNQRYYMAGKKFIKDDAGPDLLTETTTLYTVLYQGTDSSGPAVGAGILKLGPQQLADLVQTIHVLNAPNTIESARAVVKFLKFFLGELWESFV